MSMSGKLRQFKDIKPIGFSFALYDPSPLEINKIDWPNEIFEMLEGFLFAHY